MYVPTYPRTHVHMHEHSKTHAPAPCTRTCVLMHAHFQGHEGSSLVPGANVFLQCDCSYTSSTGQRRLCVHTLCLKVSDDPVEVFRFVDCDAVTNLLIRKGA